MPEIRDYHVINRLVAQALENGEHEIQLAGVDGQRLLLERLTGPWKARIEINGNAGPELAFAMNAPSVAVDCLGNAADGTGAHLNAGLLTIRGSTGAAAALCQHGGTIVVHGQTGPRAALRMNGGILVLMSSPATRTGEWQSGGTIYQPPQTQADTARHGGLVLDLALCDPELLR